MREFDIQYPYYKFADNKRLSVATTHPSFARIWPMRSPSTILGVYGSTEIAWRYQNETT